MTPEQIFSAASNIALLSWLLLIFAGRKPWAAGLTTGVIIPLLLSVAYVGLFLGHWGEANGGGFSTLAQVAALFSNPWLLLAGWIHYLAFDLFIGSWEVRDAAKVGVPHLAVIPALVLTFLLGPAGLLVYMTIRFLRTRSLRLS